MANSRPGSNGFVDRTNAKGQTALHLAAMDNNLTKVKNLISQGAKVNLQDDRNRTPLHWAAYFNKNDSYHKVIEALVENGAKINLKDKLNQTPLHFLVEYSSYKSIGLLMKNDADIYAADKEGKRPLDALLQSLMWYEASVDRRAILKDLLEHHPDPIGSYLINLSANLSKNKKLKDLIKLTCTRTVKYSFRGCDHIRAVDENHESVVFKRLELLLHCLVHFEESMGRRKQLENFLKVHHDPVGYFFLNSATKLQRYFCESVITHYSKLLALGAPVCSYVLQFVMKQTDTYRLHYVECREELARAVQRPLNLPLTNFFNLAVGFGMKFFILDWKTKRATRIFRIYGPEMLRNIDQEIDTRLTLQKGITLLSECLRSYNLNESVILGILNWLTLKDLIYFTSN